MIRSRFLVALALAALLLMVASTAQLSDNLASAAVPVAGKNCQEDEPCWTWSTMGNKRRGIVTMWGTPKVVTCGQYRHLYRTGNLDIGSRPGSMRGDWSCIGRSILPAS